MEEKGKGWGGGGGGACACLCKYKYNTVVRGGQSDVKQPTSQVLGGQSDPLLPS